MFDGDRCHRRAGYRWIGPVHEVVTWCGDGPELWRPHAGFWIHHHPDDTKSRASYLPLLERAVREEPHNPRQQVYYARELFFVGQWVQARVEFTKFLAMPEAAWPAERAQAYRYLAKMDDYPERWLLKAIAEDPSRRDAMVDLVDLLVADERWDEAKGMAARALRITGRPSDYMTTAHAYDDAHLARVLSK
jgi:tetratricopeptide (TPR) repeat protein